MIIEKTVIDTVEQVAVIMIAIHLVLLIIYIIVRIGDFFVNPRWRSGSSIFNSMSFDYTEDGPTYRDLRNQLSNHHESYTDVYVHRYHELLLTAPAFFDVTLPEAIDYEAAVHDAHAALENHDDNETALTTHVSLVNTVTKLWNALQEKAESIGINGLSMKDRERIGKYTDALTHHSLTDQEYRVYLSRLTEIYAKIHYSRNGEDTAVQVHSIRPNLALSTHLAQLAQQKPRALDM